MPLARLFSLHLLPALLAALLLAAVPAPADASLKSEAPSAANHNIFLPPKLLDQTTRRPRHTASLEEFFEIDDDAEQYFKAPPVLVRWHSGFTFVVEAAPSAYRPVPPSHRVCAAYPTGPPST